LSAQDEGLLIQTKIALSSQHPHTPSDTVSTPLTMVEATDDSIIFATSETTLARSCLMMERFQFAYGWTTNWSKSLAFVLNAPSPPLTLRLPSIPSNPSLPHSISLKSVSVVSSHFEFLRIETNNPDKHFSRLKLLVNSFQFPSLSIPLPFTALRRIIAQSLASKLRPLLSFHAISDSQAAELDYMISRRVHDYFSFPFQFNSTLLSLPLSSFGFDFPSIRRINASQAVSGLLRDINHHIPSFKNIAAVTIADWTCSINKCRYPLDGSSITDEKPTFQRQTHSLPYTWIVAHSVLSKTNTQIRQTDMSFLFTGNVSLRHLLHALPSTTLTPTPANILALERAQSANLCSFGNWIFHYYDRSIIWRWNENLRDKLRGSTAFAAYSLVRDWIGNWSLQSLANGLVGVSTDISHPNLANDRSSLIIPPLIRKSIAENSLLAILHSSTLPSLPQPYPNTNLIFSSDASMLPFSPDSSSHHSVIFSSNTPFGSAAYSLLLYQKSASVPLGEAYGLLTCTLTFLRHLSSLPSIIYTDHLNSSRLINDALISLPPPHSWSSLPARSLYRWMLDILHRTRMIPQIKYIPAHTGSMDSASLANHFADVVASRSQHDPMPPPYAPLPTFFMDSYTLFSSSHSYIESNVSSYISTALVTHQTADTSFRPSLTLMLPIHNRTCPPEHPYIRASSSYSALVQLYARSSQLDTRLLRFLRFGNCTPWCSFGCNELESDHHLFVKCPAFDSFRSESSSSIISETNAILSNSEAINPSERDDLIQRANILLTD
ncbi:hypothetical protein F5880DRAFT_1463346, partial [Lentinula raphanica]